MIRNIYELRLYGRGLILAFKIKYTMGEESLLIKAKQPWGDNQIMVDEVPLNNEGFVRLWEFFNSGLNKRFRLASLTNELNNLKDKLEAIDYKISEAEKDYKHTVENTSFLGAIFSSRISYTEAFVKSLKDQRAIIYDQLTDDIETLETYNYTKYKISIIAPYRLRKYVSQPQRNGIPKFKSYNHSIHNDSYVDVRLSTENELASASKSADEIERIANERNLADRIKVDVEHNPHCPYCNAILDYTNPTSVHLDHIYPIVKGGKSELSNMVYVCASCNLRKGKKTWRKFVRDNGYSLRAVEKRLEKLNKDF